MTSSAPTPHQQGTADTLEHGNWYPDNLARIQQTLAALPQLGADRPRVAVFDFDNTCVFRDVGQAVFFHQLTGLRYRLPPDQFCQLLPSGLTDLAGRPMASITGALAAAYLKLWPFMEKNEGDAACSLPEYRLFATLLLWLTDQARKDERLGPRYVLPFMGKLLAGYTLTELRQFAAQVMTKAMAEPLEKQTLTCDAGPPLGELAASHSLGLHVHGEMRQLMHLLGRYKVTCYVVSASTEWLVEEAVKLLDFPVTADCVYGIRVALDGGNTLTIQSPQDYPVTFREGKAAIINRFIPGEPVLVAGDADTDYEMLTLPDVPLRLLINRNQRGLISSLYQDPRILLQGLDLLTGRFRPDRLSTAS